MGRNTGIFLSVAFACVLKSELLWIQRVVVMASSAELMASAVPTHAKMGYALQVSNERRYWVSGTIHCSTLIGGPPWLELLRLRKRNFVFVGWLNYHVRTLAVFAQMYLRALIMADQNMDKWSHKHISHVHGWFIDHMLFSWLQTWRSLRCAVRKNMWHAIQTQIR